MGSFSKAAKVLALTAAAAMAGEAAALSPVPPPERIYVGTYTGGASEGIYILEYDEDNKTLENRGLAVATENPGFLALHPTLSVLYAVGEASDGGTVSAFRIEPKSGRLERMNDVSSVGKGPCHVAVAPNGKHVAVANYGGGSTALLPVNDDGTLGEASAFFQHEGTGPNEKRQEKAHAHGVYFSKTGEYLFVPDLGADKVFIYAYDVYNGSVTPAPVPYAALAPGDGPRHLALHPRLFYAYVINELSNTVTTFDYNGSDGTLTNGRAVSTLPESFSDGTTAEIFVHPSRPFVYGSNRGHDSIAAYRIDEATGDLTLIGHTPTGGKTPRNFAINPNGTRLLAANQASDTVVEFSIDTETGQLTATGTVVDVPTPVCLLYAR